MIEILFRGKRVHGKEKEWVFGGVVCADKDTLWSKKDKVFITEIPKYLSSLNLIEVIPETLGQYTGLTDKNGKKIFEGDIIVCRQAINGNFIDYHIEIGFVEMKHGAFGLHRKQGYYRPFKDWLEDYEYEIIGNIHDKPELLKGGTDNGHP